MAEEKTPTEKQEPSLEDELAVGTSDPAEIDDNTDLTAPPKSDEQKDKGQKPDDSTKAEWDSKRQELDQEHANARKRYEAQIDELNAERHGLQAQMDDLREKLEKPKEKSGASADDLTEESEYGVVVEQVKAVAKAIQDQSQKTDKLTKDLSVLSKAQAEDADVQAERGMVASLVKEFGPEHQNSAQAAAAEFLRQQGRTTENPPTQLETWLALRTAFGALAQKAKSQKSSETKEVITLDTGKGGGVPQAGPVEGTLEDVLADMHAKAGA